MIDSPGKEKNKGIRNNFSPMIGMFFMLYIRGHAGSTTNYGGCCSHPPVGT